MVEGSAGEGFGRKELQKRVQEIITPLDVETTTALNAGQQFTSSFIQCDDASAIIGVVDTDQNGDLKIQHSHDGSTVVGEEVISYTANDKLAIEKSTHMKFYRIIFDNTSGSNQSSMQLHISRRRQG